MDYFNSIINIIGGLALFLFGVDQSSRFFRENLGSSARDVMARFTQKNGQAFLLGVVLSALTQSSTIATSFAVGFVDVGMLSFAGSLIVMMGASLGGTFVSFLLSLNLFEYAPLMFGLSYFLGKAKNKWVSSIFGLIKCLSLIFLGMLILGFGTKPLFADPHFSALMTRCASNGLLMGLITFLCSGVLQSSSAVMALGISLAAAGALPATSALPIALGAHIGSTTMVLLAGMSGSLSARRLGLATFLFKLLGGLAFLCILPFVHHLFLRGGISAANELVYGQVLIASFNILIFLPFPHFLARLATKFVSARGAMGEPRYISDDLLAVPEVAITLLSKEMGRLSNYIEAYLKMLLEPKDRDENLFADLPGAIASLCDACQDFTYKIHVSSKATQLVEKFTVTSYAMSILRGMEKLLCTSMRDYLESPELHESMKASLGEELWSSWCRLSRRCVRNCLLAFVIGEKGLVASVETNEAELAALSDEIRREVGESLSYDHNASRAVRIVSQMQGFLAMAKELAQGEEFTKKQGRYLAGVAQPA